MRIALLAIALPAICLAQQNLPKLVVDAASHDFGRLAPNSVAQHRFKLANQGGAPLRITRVGSSCGCTTVLIGKDLLAAGESTELEVTFNSAGLQGPVQRSIQLESDDPVESVRTLALQAEVLGAVQVPPMPIRFTDLGLRSRPKSTVKLLSNTGQPMRVVNVTLSKAPWLGVTTREIGNDVWVDLDLLARRLPADKLSGTDSIDLEVLNPRTEVVHLEVRWEKRPPVIADPARVSWVAPGGTAQTASVTLEHLEGQPFRILATRSSHPFLHAVAGKEAAARQTVKVNLDPYVQPGPFDEKVYLTLDTPGHPEFELRVVATLR